MKALLWAALLLCVGAAGAKDDNWTTPLATKLGVRFEAQFDSSGPDAWDPKAHPLVFITTEGPGYGGLLSGVKLPGLAIFAVVLGFNLLGDALRDHFDPRRRKE